MSQNRVLLANVDAAGAGAAITVGIGGEFMFIVEGTFGTSAALQVQGPNGTWINIGGDATMTAAGACIVDLAPGSYRVNVVGTPTDMYASLISTVD
jgi:hypothetical protein